MPVKILRGNYFTGSEAANILNIEVALDSKKINGYRIENMILIRERDIYKYAKVNKILLPGNAERGEGPYKRH